MPKIPHPPQNDIIKYLIRRGFLPRSQKGSHVKLQRHGVAIIIPAGNQRIKPGLLLQILKTAEIDRDEFIRDYNKGLVK